MHHMQRVQVGKRVLMTVNADFFPPSIINVVGACHGAPNAHQPRLAQLARCLCVCVCVCVRANVVAVGVLQCNLFVPVMWISFWVCCNRQQRAMPFPALLYACAPHICASQFVSSMCSCLPDSARLSTTSSSNQLLRPSGPPPPPLDLPLAPFLATPSSPFLPPTPWAAPAWPPTPWVAHALPRLLKHI